MLVSALLAGCSGGPALEGLFNNERDYDASFAAHVQAWERAIGTTADINDVRRTFEVRGGGCDVTDGSASLSCGVEVVPRYPSIFTKRIIWTMSFGQAGAGRVRLQETRLDRLGWDL